MKLQRPFSFSYNIKLRQKFDIFHALQLDICMLQEIKCIEKCSIDDGNGTMFIFFGMTSESAGILSWSKVKFIDTNYVVHQVLQVLAIINDLQLVGKCCYVPTKCVNDSQEKSFYSSLHHIIEKTQYHTNMS